MNGIEIPLKAKSFSAIYLSAVGTMLLLAVGLSRIGFQYQAGCADTLENASVIFRNIGIVALILLGLNFFKNFNKNLDKLGLTSWALCRYLLIYAFVPETVNKLMGIHYKYSFFLANERILDVDPRNLIWQSYATSDNLELLIGIAQLLIILMLIFRRTSLIGALLLLPVMLTNMSLAVAFKSCSLLYYATLFSYNIGIIFYQLPSIINWVRRQSFPKVIDFNKKEYELFSGSMNLIKIMVVIGFMTMYLTSVNRYGNFYGYFKDHPLVGIWKVDSLCTQTSSFPTFEKLILDKSIEGEVEVADSTVKFRYLVDTLYNQIELYHFHDYKQLDLKGKYKLIDSNTVEYIGRNQKDSLSFRMKKIPTSLEKLNTKKGILFD